MRFYCCLLFVTVFFNACSKDQSSPPDPDGSIDPVNLPPKDFNVTVDSIFAERAVISWSNAVDPEGDSVKYDIWLNERLVISDVSGLTYNLSGLVELTAYSGKVIARDGENKQLIKSFSFTTEKYYFKFLKLYEYDKYISPLNPGGGEVKQIIKMRDGFYIVVGASYVDGAYANGSQIFAMKIDYYGKEIWKKYYPYSAGPAFDVAATESLNGLLIVSYINLLNIDTDGNLIWYKKIESYDDGDGGTEIRSVKQDSEGNIFIAGGRTAPEPDILQEGVVTKLDQFGNIIWEKAFKPSIRGFFYDIQITTSNELVVLGTRETDGITYEQHLKGDPPEQTDYWIVKLSAGGEEIWQKTYGDRRFDIPSKMILKSNENYVFVGSSWGIASDLQGRMFEITPDGSEVRSLSYGVPMSFTLSVAETRDGGLVTTGFAELSSSKALQISKFSDSGMEEWNRVYYELNTFLFGRSILPEEDGGYRIAVSEANYIGYGNPAHIAVYKTDPLGRYK
ncbi:MAG: hypothetical protein BGP14_17375 [Sphingobacteriales bacterium 44-15]|nr:MAG: hypothetical protein BGP14_17375 [Sphingobacteriales bacterium 44-15]